MLLHFSQPVTSHLGAVKKKIVSQTNGNYLGIIELISLYDPFLAEHFIKRVNLYIWLENRFFDLL